MEGKTMKLSPKDMVLAALFTALTVVGAKINFLLPGIPITFQPIIVMLAGCLLGSKPAFLSQVVYVLIGLIGIPVFAKPIAGPVYLVQPSFGYLIGFIISAFVIGLIIEKSKKKNLLKFIIANMTGLFIIYFFGVLYMYGLMNLFLGKNISIIKAIIAGAFQLFLLKDIILGFLVSFIALNIYNRIKFLS
jgi:biotin transport system substrate-specific component